MSDLRALKQRIDIIDVLKKIGARTRVTDDWADEVQVWCPFCDDATSHKPAASANVMSGLYHCYSCGFGSDVVGLVVEWLKSNETPDPFWGSYVGRDTAVAWLEERWPAPEEEDDAWTS